MKIALLRKVIQGKKEGERRLSTMNTKTRKALEDYWDVEHAYYSSVLAGSKIDRNDFFRLAQGSQ